MENGLDPDGEDDSHLFAVQTAEDLMLQKVCLSVYLCQYGSAVYWGKCFRRCAHVEPYEHGTQL